MKKKRINKSDSKFDYRGDSLVVFWILEGNIVSAKALRTLARDRTDTENIRTGFVISDSVDEKLCHDRKLRRVEVEYIMNLNSDIVIFNETQRTICSLVRAFYLP